MRSSFVQRLKSQKNPTVPTRQSQSQEKSTPHSTKLKNLGNGQIRKFKQEHADLKKLLSILQEKPNPQLMGNTNVKLSPCKFKQKNISLAGSVLLKGFSQSQSPQKKYQRKQNINFQRLNHRQSSNSCNKTSSTNQKQIFRNRKIDKSFLVFSQKRIKNVENQEQIQTFQSPPFNLERRQYSILQNKSVIYEFPTSNKRKVVNKSQVNKQKFINNISVEKNEKIISKIQEKQQVRKSPLKSSNLIKGKRGLQNMGNTCYINSILQCLFHLPVFNQYFEKQQFNKEQNQQISKQQNLKINIKDSLIKLNSDKKIIQKYRELYLYVMKGYLNSDESNKSTSGLKLALSKTCSLFLDWQQQDAHEFMRKLLDSMHQEINRAKKNVSYRLLGTKKQNKKPISAIADQYFKYYMERDDSYIYDYLGGQIYNKVRCINCQCESNTFDNFLDLSISMAKGKNKLEDLLEEFFCEEKLGDYYRCDKCSKTNKNCIKTTKLWRYPQILIIHLKRSQYGKKIQDSIKIPFEALSFKPYLSSQLPSNLKDPKYSLKSIICHRGVIQGGHYWSVVRQFGQWYQVDDSQVYKVKQTQIKKRFEQQGSSQAYILFYSLMNV